MEPNDRRFEKGFFTRMRFAIAGAYPTLATRARLFRMGAIAGAVVALALVADAVLGRSSLVAGPLSESHALFARDCTSCHTPAKGAMNVTCESCHQKSGGNRRVYSLSRHYQYKSEDVDRGSPDHLSLDCAQCHREHRGREVSLKSVPDNYCTRCHASGPFGNGHPEFEFRRKKLPDKSNLVFTHVRHVYEVKKSDSLATATQACAHCHVAEPDGRTFKPITYARACDGCHLLPGEGTPPIPQQSGGRPGVVSLAEIRRSGGVGSEWAAYWNAAEFDDGGGTIRKKPVFHADPWVMHNLTRLRKVMYPSADLADLLRTSAEGPSRALYEEAIRTLETQISSVRGNPSPDVKTEMEALTEMLRQVRARLDDPYAALDPSRFAVTDADAAPGIDLAAYTDVVNTLTKPCQYCHVVEHATIKRVQADQRTLVRAEFDHRKHVLHADCLDCHAEIPIRELIDARASEAPASRDRAEIQNLPGIDRCLSCHTKRAAPVRCSSCHLFHPDKSHFASLTR